MQQNTLSQIVCRWAPACRKALCADLETIYIAAEQQAEMALENMAKKWTLPIRGRKEAMNPFAIRFADCPQGEKGTCLPAELF